MYIVLKVYLGMMDSDGGKMPAVLTMTFTQAVSLRQQLRPISILKKHEFRIRVTAPSYDSEALTTPWSTHLQSDHLETSRRPFQRI